MPNINYVAQGLDGEQIEDALTAIDGVVSQENNGKVLAIENGKIVAKSASEWTDTPVLEAVTITENGTTTPPAGVDGFNSVIVNVQGGGSAVVQPLSVTQNGTYNPPSGVDGYAPVTVNVSGGGSGGPLAYLNPYAENITTGYVANGDWVYSGTQYTNLNTTMFAVEANHSYLFMSGEAHERFRAMFTTEDLSQVTSNVTGTLIINQDTIPALTGVSYTATQNGYVAVYVGSKEKKVYGFEGSLP